MGGSSTAVASSHPKRLRLVVIDDDYAAEALVDSLLLRGFDASRIRSVAHAHEQITQICSSDLVVLDMLMDGGDSQTGAAAGLGIAKAIRARGESPHILVLSAIQDQRLVDTIGQAPNTTFMSKLSNSSLTDIVAFIEGKLGKGSKVPMTRTFIVHGHDEAAKLALKNYLQNTLRLPEPTILHELPSLGKTVIEKFETATAKIDIVFVLLTPDDKAASNDNPNDLKRRARQNVVFELGYFLGRLGRSNGRVLLLHKGPIELPSDIAGIIYVDISNGIEAAGESIRKELTDVL